jgi:hypothetical protein
VPRRYLLLASLLVAGAVQAQSVPAPQASDSWSQPAPAVTTGYRDATPVNNHTPSSHFKFKDRRQQADLPGNAAQEQSGKAQVGGMGEMDRDGRPAVNCPQTPMDPACH